MAEFSAPPDATTSCFAAQGTKLVVGGGAGCREAWRYGVEAARVDEEVEAKQGKQGTAGGKTPQKTMEKTPKKNTPPDRGIQTGEEKSKKIQVVEIVMVSI